MSHSFASEGQAHPLDTKPAQDSRVMLGSIKGGAAKQPAVSRALAGTKNLQPSSESLTLHALNSYQAWPYLLLEAAEAHKFAALRYIGALPQLVRHANECIFIQPLLRP